MVRATLEETRSESSCVDQGDGAQATLLLVSHCLELQFSGCFGLEHLANTLQFSKLFLFSASFRLKVAILLLF